MASHLLAPFTNTLVLMDDSDDPAILYFHSAQTGNIPGMERALEREPGLLHQVDVFTQRSALHIAAGCPGPAGLAAVKWLLDKGLPWSTRDADQNLPETVALMCQNKHSQLFLREYGLKSLYNLFYNTSRVEESPDYDKPANYLTIGEPHPDQSKSFCNQPIMYINPRGAPEDEVAMISLPSGTGVMMEWERPIMRETARLLLDGMPTSPLRILNIGFGIGMIDTYFQNAHPTEHVIIEAHPTCVDWMRVNGWFARPGVRVLQGRWQDFLERDPQVPLGKFDIVYFDTFAEGYRAHVAFIKHLPRLLRGPASRFSYFNGHGRRHPVFYEITAEVQRLHNNDVGLNTTFFNVHVDNKTIWYYIQSRNADANEHYPQLIPICQLAPTVFGTIVPGAGWNNSHGYD